MIRTAKLLDLSAIVDLMIDDACEYADSHSVMTRHSSADRNDPVTLAKFRDRYLKMAAEWVKNHYVVLAFDQNEQPQGIIIAVRQENIWDPDIIDLRAVVWYVRPEHRRSLMAARLLKYWQKDIDRLIDQKKIGMASVAIPQSLRIDLPAPWQAHETNWIRG